jgi:Protein of unknown function (DUF3995)
MNIRKRMEQIAPVTTVTGLSAAAAIHAAWGLGSTWPADGPRELAQLVVGVDTFPSRASCAVVAGLLAGAAGCVMLKATNSLLLRDGASPDDRHGLIVRGAHLGTQITASALLLRGVGGFVVEAFELRPSNAQFRRWDLRLYSPLCIALGAGAAIVARGTERR